ncbi:helix-turn-helix transcriptional regulator [Puia dinghuensis]|uniref:HTH luxR-type domain-containing protein n=1 Tax=Puia dinghuensis TaxID=1792502 RepID=A0A8J2UJG3_9BACT|nr:response regulator transcription factor [Puia dinghuensis]GGB25007.1 hypothetical protein GCM10011511_56180 [Puia dinghuensis]
MATRFFRRYKYALLYGVALAMLLFLLKWLEWRFIIFDHALEVYSGALAILFTGLGIWLALRLSRPKVSTVIIEKEVPAPAPEVPAVAPAASDTAPATPIPDEKQIALLGLSAREIEVLQGMAEGLSNQEIADRLFVSLNTIKTHTSRIFEKLDVRRRTQAVEKAKRLRIIV